MVGSIGAPWIYGEMLGWILDGSQGIPRAQ